jgi:hypothetical protein
MRAKEVTLSPRRKRLETNRFVPLGAMEIVSPIARNIRKVCRYQKEN